MHHKIRRSIHHNCTVRMSYRSIRSIHRNHRSRTNRQMIRWNHRRSTIPHWNRMNHVNRWSLVIAGHAASDASHMSPMNQTIPMNLTSPSIRSFLHRNHSNHDGTDLLLHNQPRTR